MIGDLLYGLFIEPISNGVLFQGYAFLFKISPFWGPPVFAILFWYAWVSYKRAEFIRKQKYVLLEIKLPREVTKSPRAMELALAGFHNTGGESTWYDRYILGKVRAWSSFEIASIEGKIHFFVWTREAFRNIAEASLYSQYPEIDIMEVPDYTSVFPYFDYHEMSLWGAYYGLNKKVNEKQNDAYPIRTYIDYELDKDPKEEFKIDPITSVLEYLSTVGKGEQVWMQFLIRAHREPFKGGFGLASDTDMKEDGKIAVQEFRKSLIEAPSKEGGMVFSKIPTKGEAETIAAMERKLAKPLFDFGMRVVYVGKPENFQGGRIGGFANIMKPFYTANMNNIGVKSDTTVDYPWEDFNQIRQNKMRKKMLAGYRLRSWFHPPYKKKASVLSAEELATIFHFPGSVAATPSLTRSMAKRAEAPENLPR